MILAVARVAAWTLLVAGIAAATAAPAPPAASPVERSGFRIVAADLHVHAFPGDGALAAWDIRREARRRGLDVVAITNHNQLLAHRLDRLIVPEPPPPLTLTAEELTAPGYHLVAIGIREPIDWRLPAAGAVRAIHAQGGIAIAAHPVGKYREQLDDEALALLDGVEVAHPIRRVDPSAGGQLDRLYARAARIKPSMAAIGSSDYHFNAPIGSWRTLVFARDLTQEAIFEAIRAGRTVAVGETGRVFGPPEWLAAIGPDVPAAPRPDTRRHRASVAMAWLSLLFLVTFGRTAKPPAGLGV